MKHVDSEEKIWEKEKCQKEKRNASRIWRIASILLLVPEEQQELVKDDELLKQVAMRKQSNAEKPQADGKGQQMFGDDCETCQRNTKP